MYSHLAVLVGCVELLRTWTDEHVAQFLAIPTILFDRGGECDELAGTPAEDLLSSFEANGLMKIERGPKTLTIDLTIRGRSVLDDVLRGVEYLDSASQGCVNSASLQDVLQRSVERSRATATRLRKTPSRSSRARA